VRGCRRQPGLPQCNRLRCVCRGARLSQRFVVSNTFTGVGQLSHAEFHELLAAARSGITSRPGGSWFCAVPGTIRVLLAETGRHAHDLVSNGRFDLGWARATASRSSRLLHPHRRSETERFDDAMAFPTQGRGRQRPLLALVRDPLDSTTSSIEPRPVQQQHPPLWMAGPAQLRVDPARAAQGGL